MKQYLGYGGVGDCFIIILKLLEQEKDLRNFTYTHIESGVEKLEMCHDLLNYYKIKHNLIKTPNLRAWWYQNSHKFDKCFNVSIEGSINVPPRDFHWEPCQDEGVSQAFNPEPSLAKKYPLCIQVNGGLKCENKVRNCEKRGVVEYVNRIFKSNKDNIVWVGINEEFNPPWGTNYSGKISLEETMKIISKSEKFIGFNSILLYWALYNKVDSHLFMDHQGKFDIRIHEKWKQHLTFVN